MRLSSGGWKTLTLNIVYDVVGSVIYALGTLCFIAPNNIAPGGASGIAIMLHFLFGFPIGTTAFLINVPLLLLAFRYLGRPFTFRTLRTVAINTIVLDLGVGPLVEKWNLADAVGQDRLMGALFGGVCLGVGLAVIFLRDSTTGGTDIAGRLLQLRYPHIQTGRAMMICDAFVLAASVVVFGSLESGLHGLVTIFVNSRVIDAVLYGADKGTMAFIVSKDSRMVAERVLQELERGVTLLKGEGAFSGEGREVILTAVRISQLPRLKRIVHESDPEAFLIAAEAGEILGKGFKRMN